MSRRQQGAIPTARVRRLSRLMSWAGSVPQGRVFSLIEDAEKANEYALKAAEERLVGPPFRLQLRSYERCAPRSLSNLSGRVDSGS